MCIRCSANGRRRRTPIGWIGNYLHGGTTSMISAGELHVPGIDYENLTPELVTSLAIVTAATTGRVRWSGVKLYAGTALMVPGMTETHFDRLAACGVKWIKFLFYPFKDDTSEARNYVQWAHARGMRVKVHTGGVSRSGASVVCGYSILSWLQPDIAAHVSGGPIPMCDEDIDAVVDNTSFSLEVCSSGNYRSTARLVVAPDREESAQSPYARHRYARRNRRHPAGHASQRPVLCVDVQSQRRSGGGGRDWQYRARP